MLAFQRPLVVLRLEQLELRLSFLQGTLSENTFLLVMLLLAELVALAALFGSFAVLFFEELVIFLLRSAVLFLPKLICLHFLSFDTKTLFEKSLAIKALLFLSAQLFVETDLHLTFPLEPFLASLIFEPPLFLKPPLFLELPPLLPLASFLECPIFLFLPLRLRLGSFSALRLRLPLWFRCSTFGLGPTG
ncbi:hypothetical protein BC826DRAFT_1081499 [Russula brevipes]|nr:hypothetical protein BC826DRAFT_1081499 [Russula brevipes]